MKKHIIVILIFAFSVNYVLPASAEEAGNTGIPGAAPLTLSECYQLALAQSEIIAINEDLIKETEAHFLQALSTVVPHVSFISEDVRRKESNSSTVENHRTSAQRKFNVTETLFSGFKAFNAIEGSKYERLQRTDEKIRAEQLLLVDVSNVFYLLIEVREDLSALKTIRDAYSSRIKELIARESIGRSRVSEVANAKTQLYGVQASIKQVKSQEVIVRQLLEFLVGQPVGEVIDTYKFPITLMNEDYYTAKALMRPDVKAAKSAWEVANETRKAVDSDFLPTVDVAANYYAERPDTYKGVDWDVTLNVKVPIFEGTEILGNSKAAALKADQSMELYKRAMRRAPYDIKESYVRLTTAMDVYDALMKAYNMAKHNYNFQRKDYERSLVSNLDVLTAIQTLQDAERSYIHALYEAKRQYWQLRVAVGQSGTESLNDAF
jgi:outer membrane protein